MQGSERRVWKEDANNRKANRCLCHAGSGSSFAVGGCPAGFSFSRVSEPKEGAFAILGFMHPFQLQKPILDKCVLQYKS